MKYGIQEILTWINKIDTTNPIKVKSGIKEMNRLITKYGLTMNEVREASSLRVKLID